MSGLTSSHEARKRLADAIRRSFILDGDSLPVQRSHRHPNGFTKLMIASPEASEEWYLHAWEPGADADVHDHRWDISSSVLLGSLRVERFVIAPNESKDSEQCRHFLHKPLGMAAGFELEDLGLARLVRVDDTAIPTGGFHADDSNVLHRTTSASEWCITFFRHGPVKTWITNVFRREAGSHRPERVEPVHMTVASYRDELRRLQLQIQEVFAESGDAAEVS